jgi:Zn-dependent M32 family carboxypeptidase
MRHLPRDLVREATGTERSADFLADYLDAKFGALYGA